MKVLIACEFSGIVREEFRKLGHDAWSCDLLPTEISGQHIQGNVLEILDQGWDLMIAHPPCTYLSRAGARWWKDEKRQKLADEAAEFVFKLRDANIPKIAIENPIGQLNKRWRYPDQTIQPYQFGHAYSKATCLWLKNLPVLQHTNVLKEYTPLIRSNVTRNKNQKGIYSGGLITAVTFLGIAQAMANQWGRK
jgi:site-specific DNA-cytosine methylase